MMRKPVLFIAAFVIAAVTMPLVFGLVTKHRLTSLISEAQVPEGILLELKSYDMGYFSSHALLQVMVLDPKQLQEPTEIPRNVFAFNVEADIKHGPIFMGSNLNAHTGLAHIHAFLTPESIAPANKELAKTLAAIFTEKEVISINASLSLFAALNATLQSSNANYQADDGTVSWGGIDGSLYLSSNNNVMKATIDIAPMLLQAENTSSLDFSRISIISDAERDDDMPWTGEQAINVPSFYMKDENGREIRFSNLLVTANSAITDDIAHMHVEGKAENLQLYTQKIENTVISMDVNNLNAASLVAFSKVTQNNMSELSDDEKRALTQALVNMLSPGAVFKFSHEMTIPEGPVNALVQVKFPDLSEAVKKDPIETIAQRLMMELNASLSMETPSAWLEDMLYNIALSKLPANAPSQTDPVTKKSISPQEALRKDINDQLKALSQAGVLISDDSHYAFHLNYERGNIVLNGNRLTQEDIAKLMGLFSGKPEEAK